MADTASGGRNPSMFRPSGNARRASNQSFQASANATAGGSAPPPPSAPNQPSSGPHASSSSGQQPRGGNVPPPPPPPRQNVFNININPGNGEENLIIIRNRLFHAIYFKVALMYAIIVTKPFQRALEYFVLMKAFLFFAALVYVHFTFIKDPTICWNNAHEWPRDGVLRVEVIPNLEKRVEFYEKSKNLENHIRSLRKGFFYGIGPKTHQQFRNQGDIYNNESYTLYLLDVFKTEQSIRSLYNDEKYADIEGEEYIVEYALEYGHLRLSPATREKLGVPVRLIQLDPDKNACFGDGFSKFLLRELLGYDDLLMSSVRVIAEKEHNKGYLRNVISGEHYRFVATWWTAWTSFPTAFFVMILFTFSISMLLRFSHQQIFVFIVDLLQMLEFNVTSRFPLAPLLIVSLALVGLEAIMSEFFNDTTTAFYIIIIVWLADQFDAVCCHTSITKRHWLRFFFLYHYAFYAYHYRFNGQNRSLALVSSWLFIQHSMLYFFHRYELPVIMQHTHILIMTHNEHVDGLRVVAGRAEAVAVGGGLSANRNAGSRGGGNGGGNDRRRRPQNAPSGSSSVTIEGSLTISPDLNLSGARLGNQRRPNLMRLITLHQAPRRNHGTPRTEQQPQETRQSLLPRTLLSIWEFLVQLLNANTLRRIFFRRGNIHPIFGVNIRRPTQDQRRAPQPQSRQPTTQQQVWTERPSPLGIGITCHVSTGHISRARFPSRRDGIRLPQANESELGGRGGIGRVRFIGHEHAYGRLVENVRSFESNNNNSSSNNNNNNNGGNQEPVLESINNNNNNNHSNNNEVSTAVEDRQERRERATVESGEVSKCSNTGTNKTTTTPSSAPNLANNSNDQQMKTLEEYECQTIERLIDANVEDTAYMEQAVRSPKRNVTAPTSTPQIFIDSEGSIVARRPDVSGESSSVDAVTT